ncbi:prolyl oligopeptidase family serine peptidase [Brevundimonas sp. SORGH_AS_0993]|uniref:prolyl oligopeptidase family serine peptidase n=1 Tax=Brevundimonas sp. SORGH_AS_0993 TaxID=3041794 RepID=UPI0027D7BA4F|nr:prolyl oligopeptidase family serine peptidase [Brevundimonas sp. SORGH_AS_0993]
MNDIITTPEIAGLVLSSDGKTAVYVARQADMASDRKISTLHQVDLDSRIDRILLRADWIEDVKSIPASDAWSVLADRGHGVQLYRIDPGGQITPLVQAPVTLPFGQVDGAFASNASDAPRRVGILGYAWSPSGQSLWYARVRAAPDDRKPLIDDAAWLAGWRRRWVVPAFIEYRLVTEGRDILIAERPALDRIALYYAGNVTWNGEAPSYVTEEQDGTGGPHYAAYAWNGETGRTSRLAEAPTHPFGQPALGPSGGRLKTSGFGPERRLEEVAVDGTVKTFGPVDFVLDDPPASGHWASLNGGRAIVGVRDISHPRYGLLVLEADTGGRQIQISGSLTHCDFNETATAGVCVHEGMTTPPELVSIDPVTASATSIMPLASKQSEIEPLTVEPRVWTNRLGYFSTGFVVYPRTYEPGRRYPAVIVTHGSDADERFVDQGFQWDYPIQALAERGYVVLAMNDPTAGQSADLRAAYDGWAGRRETDPKVVQDLVWRNGVFSFEDAIEEMAQAGVVDSSRVGIAGYSRGSQMVNVAMTQSKLFKAASSGDGGYLEPGSYYTIPSNPVAYNRVYGGSPFDTRALENYLRLSPTFRAAESTGAVLQQVAEPRAGAIQLHAALREAGVPAQITLYPGESLAADETHLFHIPSNRLAAMQENIDWFDFWLLGKEDTSPEKRPQYERWRRMKGAFEADRLQRQARP